MSTLAPGRPTPAVKSETFVEQQLGRARQRIRMLDLTAAGRAAVCSRAARDLSHADLESAISARRAGWLGSTVAALVLLMFVQLILGGRQFTSLFGRAFAPFAEGAIKTRTQLVLLQPEN